MKNILVCGGCGFIGSNLINELMKDNNNNVICIDNLLTGDLNNIKHHLKNIRFTFYEKDIIDSLSYIKIKIDEIYNFACPASPIHYQNNKIHTLKSSVIGVLNLLELTRINDCKFLQASTSEVYGDSLINPQDESYFGNVNPIGIRSCYDEGKRCAETLIMDYHREYKLKTKIVRIFNTYGINMQENDGRVISNFIIQALNNEDITIYGDGKQTRSFQYIDDLIDGVIKIMNTDENVYEPINIGNPDEKTILELADLIIKLTDTKSKLVFKNLPLDDPKQRKPNINKIINLINWKPNVSLEEGLIKTIEYFKNKKGE